MYLISRRKHLHFLGRQRKPKKELIQLSEKFMSVSLYACYALTEKSTVDRNLFLLPAVSIFQDRMPL